MGRGSGPDRVEDLIWGFYENMGKEERKEEKEKRESEREGEEDVDVPAVLAYRYRRLAARRCGDVE
jgi:hypothetical protein